MYAPCRYGKSPPPATPEKSLWPRCESSPYSKETYFSTFHPSLLERQRVLTPFGVGLCSREAFKTMAKKISKDDRYKKSISMPSLNAPPPSPSTLPRPPKAEKSGITITSGACGRGFIVRSNTSGGVESSWKERKSSQTPRNITFREAEIARDLSAISLGEDDLQDDIAAVRERRLSLKYMSLLDVSSCLSDENKRAAVAETLMETAARLETIATASSNDDTSNQSQSVQQRKPCCPKGALRFSGKIETSSLEKPKSTSSASRGAAWKREVTGKVCSSLVRPANLSPGTGARVTSPPRPNSDVLKVGTSVRILARPDLCHPSFSTGQHQFIRAVVTYVTCDGRYKIGTTKGVIGRLFAREELQPRDTTILRASDIPRRSITIREASTISYPSAD